MDPTVMCELLVGLGDVNVLGVDGVAGEPIRVRVEARWLRPECRRCSTSAVAKDRPVVVLVDLCVFGRPARLVWRKHRWLCPDETCRSVTWTGQEPRIGSPRLALTDRAGRWVTFQVGKHGRTVSEVAQDLGCDWHTVNDAVIAYGTPLVDDDADRIGDVRALGLDETLFCRLGWWRTQAWSTQILDVVEGRKAVGPAAWLATRGDAWCSQIRWATLDLSGPYRSVFDTILPNATQVADPFHVMKLANTKLDETRRRVQNETMGHRGRKTDPLYQIRRLLTRADERLTEKGRTKLVGLLKAGDPNSEVTTAWQPKEAIRQIYTHTDPGLATQHVERLGRGLQNPENPPEVRSLGRTLIRWRDQIAAWHQAHVTNAPTEAANNLIKRIKRIAFGFRQFRNYRIRTLLYAGKPNWDLLATITPR
ncbi:MAG: ISL3 family transposase [Acidobacteria bacterium]|nr:ISL3 family transposase [Acidobacteriota bacterium]